jgi:hypothetical protein
MSNLLTRKIGEINKSVQTQREVLTRKLHDLIESLSRKFSELESQQKELISQFNLLYKQTQVAAQNETAVLKVARQRCAQQVTDLKRIIAQLETTSASRPDKPRMEAVPVTKTMDPKLLSACRQNLLVLETELEKCQRDNDKVSLEFQQFKTQAAGAQKSSEETIIQRQFESQHDLQILQRKLLELEREQKSCQATTENKSKELLLVTEKLMTEQDQGKILKLQNERLKRSNDWIGTSLDTSLDLDMNLSTTQVAENMLRQLRIRNRQDPFLGMHPLNFFVLFKDQTFANRFTKETENHTTLIPDYLRFYYEQSRTIERDNICRMLYTSLTLIYFREQSPKLYTQEFGPLEAKEISPQVSLLLYRPILQVILVPPLFKMVTVDKMEKYVWGQIDVSVPENLLSPILNLQLLQ